MRRGKSQRWRRQDDRQLRMILGDQRPEISTAPEPHGIERARADHPSTKGTPNPEIGYRGFVDDQFVAWWDAWSS